MARAFSLKELTVGFFRLHAGRKKYTATGIDGIRTGDTNSINVIGGGGASFDYYISPTGSDSNSGLLGSPWAITALWTKASTYAGKRLGILDGTYSGYNGSNYNGNDVAHIIPASAGGTASVRTIVQSVNARGATLNGAGGNAGGSNTRAKVVLLVQAPYTTVGNLTVREGVYFGMQVNASNVSILGNHCHRIDRVAYGDGGVDNEAGIALSNNSNGAYVAHNYCHDIVTGDGTHESGILMYHGTNSIIEYNECEDAECGVQPKDDCGGTIVRYNYLHNLTRPLQYGTNNGFAVTYNNNVIVGWTQNGYSRDNYAEAAGTAFFNNTFIVSQSGAAGVLILNTTSAVAFYNNLIMRVGGSSNSYGDMNASGSSAFSLSDYNLYGTTATLHSPAGTPRTFTAYKAQIGNLDVHSQQANATFVSGGSGPYAYKLDTGSNGLGDGSSDGTTGGSAVNVGAFRSSDQSEQIGPNWRWPA